jgi:hypothetical protein
MVPSRIYLIGTPLESFLAPRRAHQLNLKLLRSKQAFVSRDKPGERENGAAGDITGDLPDQRLPPASKMHKFLRAAIHAFESTKKILIL